MFTSIVQICVLISSSDVICDNMIINTSGLSGHFMAVDLNIEHLISYLKVYKVVLLMSLDIIVFLDVFHC